MEWRWSDDGLQSPLSPEGRNAERKSSTPAIVVSRLMDVARYIERPRACARPYKARRRPIRWQPLCVSSVRNMPATDCVDINCKPSLSLSLSLSLSFLSLSPLPFSLPPSSLPFYRYLIITLILPLFGYCCSCRYYNWEEFLAIYKKFWMLR